MLEAVIISLMIVWLIGLFTGTAGNLIHLILVAALVMFAVRFMTGRKTNLIGRRKFLN